LHWLHGKFETNWIVTMLIYLLRLNGYHTHTKIPTLWRAYSVPFPVVVWNCEVPGYLGF